MDSLPSYYEFGSCSNSVNPSIVCSSRLTAEEKAVAASKSHSEAERRRRKRINGHLATLRTLVPNTVKADKASLLEEVVRRLRELKKTAAELAAGDCSDNIYESYESSTEGAAAAARQYYKLIPSEADELKLCYCDCEVGDSGTLIMATICCEDWPDLLSDMTRAVRSVEGKVVRAEMSTVGGRTKSILWVQVSAGGGDERLGTLRRALKVALDYKASLSTGN